MLEAELVLQGPGLLAAGLARGRINSSDVVALVFENNGLDIDVRTKRKAHPESYPKLGELLGMIGAQCAKDKIAVERLRVGVILSGGNLDLDRLPWQTGKAGAP